MPAGPCAGTAPGAAAGLVALGAGAVGTAPGAASAAAGGAAGLDPSAGAVTAGGVGVVPNIEGFPVWISHRSQSRNSDMPKKTHKTVRRKSVPIGCSIPTAISIDR